MTLGKGRAAAIDDSDYSDLAIELACHPADLEAIAIVESDGFGWFKDGRIKILFEKHWFYKLVPDDKRQRAIKAGVARKSWVSPSKGGYKDQIGADARYKLLQKAMNIDTEAALQSISMGRFQIMGFNYKICGFKSADQMWRMFLDDEYNQLRAFANFLTAKGLVKALQDREYDRIEKGYNGGGLNGAYAAKMKRKANELRKGKWKDWSPSQKPTQAPKPQPRPAQRKSTKPASAPRKSAKGGIIVLVLAALAGIGAFWGNLIDKIQTLFGG